MTPLETLIEERAELAADLEQLESQLTLARAERAEAEAAYDAEADKLDRAADLARKEAADPSAAGVLRSQHRDERAERLRAFEGPRARARSRVRSLESSIAGRRLGISHLNQAIAALGPALFEAARRRTPEPMDFDTIVKEA